MNCKLT